MHPVNHAEKLGNSSQPIGPMVLVLYDGQRIVPRGAFTYRGPCPPSGQHRYQWTIDTEDAAGHTLATATITKKFPPE